MALDDERNACIAYGKAFKKAVQKFLGKAGRIWLGSRVQYSERHSTQFLKDNDGI